MRTKPTKYLVSLLNPGNEVSLKDYGGLELLLSETKGYIRRHSIERLHILGL